MSFGASPEPIQNECRALERYQVLFEKNSELVSMDEVVYDERGRPINWIIREINPTYARVMGVSREEAADKTVTDVYGLDRPPEDQLQAYAQVTATGVPGRLETHLEHVNRDFLLSIFPIGGRCFGKVMTDVTDLRQSLERSIADLEHESRRATALERVAEAGISTLALQELLQHSLSELLELLARILAAF